MKKNISTHTILLSTLALVDAEEAFKICLKWLKQEDIYRTIMALEQIIRLGSWNPDRFEEALISLNSFWQTEKLRTKPTATKAYFKLILMAHLAKALSQEGATKCLLEVFKTRGYLYPVEQDVFKACLNTIDPENAQAIYVEGFLTASELEGCRSRSDGVKSILPGLDEDAKTTFLERLVLQSGDSNVLWAAIPILLGRVSKKDGERIIKKALETDSQEKISTISQLILRIAAGEHSFKKLTSKWRFLSKVLRELKDKLGPKSLFVLVNQAANYDNESDLMLLIADFEFLFQQKEQSLEALIRAVLTAMNKLKQEQNKNKFYRLLAGFCQTRKDEVLDILTQAVREDWRDFSHCGILAYPALEFVDYFNDDSCVSLIMETITKSRRNGDLSNSINTRAAKFLVKKAISGNQQALDFVVKMPSEGIWPNVSELLLEVFQKSQISEIKAKALKSVIRRFYLVMEGKRNDLYVHLEMEVLEKIREHDEIQEGFLQGLEIGFNNVSSSDGIHNAIEKVVDFISPIFKPEAMKILEAGMLSVRKAFIDLPSYSRYDRERSRYNDCIVEINEQLLKL